MIDPRVQSLCDEFGIRIIPGHRYPDLGETRATETMARIIRRYGEAHLRNVLITLAETANNKAMLDEVGLWMASDLVLARGAGSIDSAWLGLWDRIPVGELQFACQRLRGFVPQRFALAGMVYERIYEEFDRDNPDQLDLLGDRRRA